ncbi:hypothetical protein CEP52_008507 [Fusarium oligoseptatum]|uniref:EKC/KEOPS complex subunit BUD32 n=1 Tax=Fusarium oligoseptatum TaxID=2604345 RepID=A0A428THU6_9HYPO|nr:hypothetical protein CEP52_008507 [Fusarium oligoseptatum]
MAPTNPETTSERAQYYELSPPRRIGKGRHAIVFECLDSNKRKFAMKLFKEGSQGKVEKEIEALKHLRGGPNIIEFIDAVQGDRDANIGVVLEFVDNIDFRTLYPRFTTMDIRYYIHELLKALQFTHSRGVIHCDVRPHNVVIDHPNRKLRLIGWSSHRFYVPEDEDDEISTGPWKAPEALLDFGYWHYRFDMWGLGTMLASMVFRKEPFFHGNSLQDQLRKISRVLGTESINNYIDKFGSDYWRPDVEELGHCPPRAWSTLVNENNQHLVSDEVLDFVDKLLKVDPDDRITTEEALRHPYFQALN